MPGGNSRFDYASLDPGRGLLFVAHLGASQVVEINIRTGRVVRTVGGLSQVHGVLVVPALHRVYATATGANIVVRINEDTGRILGRSPTGAYPDGLAYDPVNGTIWTTSAQGSWWPPGRAGVRTRLSDRKGAVEADSRLRLMRGSAWRMEFCDSFATAPGWLLLRCCNRILRASWAS